MPDLTIWIITDGKPGDENQCLGVAERLGGKIEIKRIAPSAPWVWAMPWGPIPPRDRPDQQNSPLSPPFPDLAIASGRRTIAYLRYLKKHHPETVTLYLKDPRTRLNGADLIWVPVHDKRRGDNVLVTLTAPHRISQANLERARTQGPQALHYLPAPRLALILGGDTKTGEFGAKAIHRLAQDLKTKVPDHMSVMVTPSRRTPDSLIKAVSQALAGHKHWIWDGEGDNPYLPMLALADVIIVTADSHSMLSDVLATSAPVYIVKPDAYPPKLDKTIEQLLQRPLIQRLDAPLETGTRTPIDSTELIADEIRRLLAQREQS